MLEERERFLYFMEKRVRAAMEVTSKLVDDVVASSECCEKEEDEVMLPGFRFHPTDEELVGFYLRRKVEKKPITIEIIEQIDIYKYDPWDLPKVSNVGEKEWYFFCIRGRKYRNSIRPNRVTVSGFWKATGIDKPIFSTLEPPNQECIGLKKSLVYYKGSAGKGTKTDWMMHEFRLPSFNTNNSSQYPHDHDAEVLTLCRIFKRIPSFRKYTPTSNNNVKTNNNIINSIISLAPENPNLNSIISTSKPNAKFQSQPFPTLIDLETKPKPSEQLNIFPQKITFFNPTLTLSYPFFEPSSLYPSSFWNGVNGGGGRGSDNVFTDGGWDELRPVVQSATDPSS